MQEKVAILGLGYVGLPLAVALAEKDVHTTGFDINERRVNELIAGVDHTDSCAPELLKQSTLHFTSSEQDLSVASIYIVTVPTPLSGKRTPDLSALTSVSSLVGKKLKKNDIVIYESTVYPGVTEDHCGPILEEFSGLKVNQDFYLAYSPERINPGDRNNTLTHINKIISASTPDALKRVESLYKIILQDKLYKAESIKVAEMAKIMENSQRDLNIAFMNECAMLCHQFGIDTQSVIKAASTKWNFLPFHPGLVGGHCISVDPYYLTHQAQEIGCEADVILAGRKRNDSMARFIVTEVMSLAFSKGLNHKSRVGIWGLTFKPDVPDSRNSGSFSLIDELQGFGVPVAIYDPVVDRELIPRKYHSLYKGAAEFKNIHILIIAVPHKELREKGWNEVKKMISAEKTIVVDIYSCLPQDEIPRGCTLWRL